MSEEYSEMILPGLEEWINAPSAPPKPSKIVITDATIDWPERDIKALEDFCRQHNILGFNCGKMAPIAALALLKRKLGINDNPLTERIPFTGTKPINNPNYTYTTMVAKKTLLHG